MFYRLNPFHANYILNVYNMSYMYLNKILFKPMINKENWHALADAHIYKHTEQKDKNSAECGVSPACPFS